MDLITKIAFLIALVCVLMWVFSAMAKHKNKKPYTMPKAPATRSRRPVRERMPEDGIIVPSLAGTYYRSDEAIAALRDCVMGESLILVPEPDNEFDPYAVKVLTMGGYHVGYIEQRYSKLVSDWIDHVAECEILSISRHKIPFVDLWITFSADPVRQPEVIPEEFQCGPEDVMRNLGRKDVDSYRYHKEVSRVEGIYEHSRETIAKIRALRKGDEIILKKGECNDYYPKRVDAYLPDGTFIGYLKSTFMSTEIFDLFDKIVKAMVDHTIGMEDVDTICVGVYFPKEAAPIRRAFVETTITLGDFGPYKEVAHAKNIRTRDPEGALDILLPIAKIEKGIEAKLQCVACYFTLKDWPARVEMINRTLRHIDSLTEEDTSIQELERMHSAIPQLLKQLDYSEKRIASQEARMLRSKR